MLQLPIGVGSSSSLINVASLAVSPRFRRSQWRNVAMSAVRTAKVLYRVAMLAPASDEHLDCLPTGGRYDGAYGVLGGLLAVEAVMERCRANPGAARRNLAVANWTNEEGARFQPSLTGSSVFAGSLPLEQAYAREDGDGVKLGEALAAIGYRGASPPEFEPVRYVELHVEQGDQLERAAADIA